MQITLEISPSDLQFTGLSWEGDHWDWDRVEFEGIELEPDQYNDDTIQDYLDIAHAPSLARTARARRHLALCALRG